MSIQKHNDLIVHFHGRSRKVRQPKKEDLQTSLPAKEQDNKMPTLPLMCLQTSSNADFKPNKKMQTEIFTGHTTAEVG